MEELKVSQTISLNRIADLLCCAWEGGSSYWARAEREQKPEKMTFVSTASTGCYQHEIPLNKGGWVQLRDIEDDKIIPQKLNLKAIKKGLQIMADKYPKHFGDFMNENEDADTGDVFLQCCIFGDVIYG